MEGGMERERERKAQVGVNDRKESREGRLQRGKMKGQMEVGMEG